MVVTLQKKRASDVFFAPQLPPPPRNKALLSMEFIPLMYHIIYCLLGGLYATYHLLREPETTIDIKGLYCPLVPMIEKMTTAKLQGSTDIAFIKVQIEKGNTFFGRGRGKRLPPRHGVFFHKKPMRDPCDWFM